MHHFLPALDPETANVPMPSTAAHWSKQPAGLLQSVGKGISVDANAVTRGVSSVPDVWARAVLFQSALQPSHPLHAEAVADWRGLLSLLALREVYGYNVDVVPVSVEGDGKLETALRTLAPAPIPLSDGTPYAWTDVLLVRLDGVPVGAFSPGSLVYTATGYRDRLRAHYNPTNGDPIPPPPVLGPDYGLVAPTKLSDEFTALYVAEYVDRLYAAYSDRAGQPLGQHPAAQRISELLEAWRTELRTAFGVAPGQPVDAEEVKKATALPAGSKVAGWPRLAEYAVYAEALYPLVEDGDGNVQGKSSIFLRHRRNHTDYQGVVVAHRDTLQGSEKVWGLHQPQSLGSTVEERLATYFGAPQGDTLGDTNLAASFACWIRPERYFLSDVLLVPREGVHVLADGERAANAGGRYLLPFRREVLDFFGPEDIQSVLQPAFEDLRDGGVRFTFKLPVGKHPGLDPVAGDGQVGPVPTLGAASDPFAGIDAVEAQSDTTVTVERIYRRKRDGDPDDGAGALVEADLPVLDLFPNYLGPSWRRYFLFQSDAGTFDCRPYAHGATLDARDRRDEVGGVERQARVMEVHGEDPFPDAVEVRTANGTAVGVVLVKRPLWDVAGVAGDWTVGIDFGTSNTNVSKRTGSDDVEGWTAHFPKLLRPLAADPAGRRDDLLQSFFVPNRTVEFPVGTLLDVRSPNPGEGRVLLDYFVHFPPRFTWPARVRSDIKWDEGGRVTEFFLEPVLLLILMEATRGRVRSIDLRCTYPRAFSSDQRQVLEGEWDRTLKALTDPDSPDAAVVGDPNQTVTVSSPSHHSEGKMAGVYFSSASAIKDARQRANTARAICVDVGGGTSDLALLYDGDIVYDSSIRIAGGDIADYIARRPKLRTALFSGEAEAALAEVQTDQRRFGARLNGVLRRENGLIPDQLNRNANNADVGQLRRLIALKFGALAFHVGTVLGAAERHGVAPGLAAKLRDGGISVHWGGNGGQLATWIDYGHYRPDGLAAKMLNGLLYYALDDAQATPNVGLLLQAQSPSPKGEAVKGVAVYEGRGDAPAGPGADILLDDEPGGDGQARTLDGVICGETITLTDGTEVAFTDPISLQTLFDGDRTTFQASSGDRLRRFIDLFNRLGTKFDLVTADTRIPDDDATITKIVELAQGKYIEMQDRKEASRAVEPVFVTEVRELMRFVASSSR